MRSVRLTLVAALAVTWAAAAAAAGDDEVRTHPVNLSLFHPASTSPDPDVRTNFRLNLIYGRVLEVQGVDIGGLVARTDGDSRGLRFGGLTSVVGGEFRGLSAVGLVDLVRRDVSGFQFTGLAAYDRGSFTGVQLSGLFGFVEHTAVGMQFSGVFNVADRAGRLFQVSLAGNIVGTDLSGFQIAGLNFTEKTLRGFQFGLMNFADSVHGFQIGGVNGALTEAGVQIGLVNLAGVNESVPIGLASFTKDSNTDWIVEGSTLLGISTGIRTSVRGWRASTVIGGTGLRDSDTEILGFGWWWGREFGLMDSLLVAPDVGFVHLTDKSPPEGEDEKRPNGQARVLFEYRVGERFAAFAGGGLSLEFTRYGSGAESDVEALGVFGVSLW